VSGREFKLLPHIFFARQINMYILMAVEVLFTNVVTCPSSANFGQRSDSSCAAGDRIADIYEPN
jgi:hypothetical protein